MAVTIGTKFRSTYADSNPEWRVTKKLGRGVWEAQITPESMDYSGVTAAFRTGDIEASLRWTNNVNSLMSEHDKWWDAQPIGTVVHYHNSFGQYVRGVVTTNSKGEKVMHPIALVGNWREYDLPRRMPDGSISYPYHAKKILTEDYEDFQPNYSNMYESPGYSRKDNSPNPATMDPIDLTVPPMTPAEQEEANKIHLLNRLVTIAQDQTISTDDRLKRIHAFSSVINLTPTTEDED